MSQFIVRFNTRFSVISYFLYFIAPFTIVSASPRMSNQSKVCAKLFTNEDHIRVFEISGTNSDWPDLYNKHSDRNIANIKLESSGGIIRLCYLDSPAAKSKCEIHDSETIGGRTPKFNYDVQHLFSVECNNQKGSLCEGHKKSNCESVRVPSDKCAVLYQDEDCNDCNFPPIILEFNKTITIEFKIPSSFKTSKANNTVKAKYKNVDNGNESECFLSGPENVTSHKICAQQDLIRKAVTYTCV